MRWYHARKVLIKYKTLLRLLFEMLVLSRFVKISLYFLKLNPGFSVGLNRNNTSLTLNGLSTFIVYKT